VIADEQALVIINLRKKAKVILTRESEAHQVDCSSEWFGYLEKLLVLLEHKHRLRFVPSLRPCSVQRVILFLSGLKISSSIISFSIGIILFHFLSRFIDRDCRSILSTAVSILLICLAFRSSGCSKIQFEFRGAFRRLLLTAKMHLTMHLLPLMVVQYLLLIDARQLWLLHGLVIIALVNPLPISQ
jgi:hypothetical protein